MSFSFFKFNFVTHTLWSFYDPFCSCCEVRKYRSDTRDHVKPAKLLPVVVVVVKNY